MIDKHIENMMKRMSNDGEWYAQEMCTKEKTHTPTQAFVLGFIDACTLIRRYIKQYHLDIPQGTCYTSRKAHKK